VSFKCYDLTDVLSHTVGIQEWLSLDDSSKVSAFGTKTGLLHSESDGASSNNTSSLEGVGSAPSDHKLKGLNASESYSRSQDSLWTEQLCVGSLVDVCDSRGGWYQVNISFRSGSDSIVNFMQPTPRRLVSWR